MLENLFMQKPLDEIKASLCGVWPPNCVVYSLLLVVLL